MFPILIKFPESIPLIGGHALHTYGAFVALAFLAGLLWVRYESIRVGLPKQKMMDLFFYIVLVAIIASRILYVFVSVDEWWRDPLVFLRIWEGGLVFYGGLIGAILVSIWYTRRHHFPFLLVADIFAPGLALGHVFGRIGCFFAGCCYGREAPAEGFFSVLFSHTEYSIAPHNYPVYPTQLFEAFGELAIFTILFFFRRFKKFDGEVFLLYIILYPILRSIIEIYRGDKIRGFIVEGVLSSAQLISIIWILLAIILWAVLSKRKNV